MKTAFRDWQRDTWGALLGGYTSFSDVLPPLPRVPAELLSVLCMPKFLAGTYHEEMTAGSGIRWGIWASQKPSGGSSLDLSEL